MPAEPSGAGYGCREAMVVMMGVCSRPEEVVVPHRSYPPPLVFSRGCENSSPDKEVSNLPFVLDKAAVTVPCPPSVPDSRSQRLRFLVQHPVYTSPVQSSYPSSSSREHLPDSGSRW